MSNAPVGLIGAGLLGTALAERMIAADLPVLGFDLDSTRRQPLEQRGARFAGGAAEVAAECQTIVLCLPDSVIVAQTVAGMGELLQPGTLLIDATTGDPEDTAALASRLLARDIDYVDATIAGSSEQACRGEAVVMMGGTSSAVRKAELVVKSWGECRFHVGPSGSGARLKLVVNLVLGLNRAVLAEGLALAAACGIDQARALEVLKATPAYSAAMETKGPKMVTGDFAAVARLAQHLKDVRLIRNLAQNHGALTPLSDVHEQLLLRAVELGLGDADNSAIIRAFTPHP